jgi:leader peptidase (prepilin peptidase)/N-methyltransferase
LATMSDFSAFFTLHPWGWCMLAAVVGACMASFGGVVVDRLPHSAGWRMQPDPNMDLTSPSKCNACGTRLGVLPLIPVVGWLVLGGRCRACHSPVPGAYPAMEAFTAALSAAWALHWGATPQGCMGLLMIWGCIVLAWIDWRETWLPDRIMIPLLMIGLLCSPFAPDPMGRIQGLTMGACIIGACMAWLSLRKQAGMFASGDFTFCAMAGAWLGAGVVPAFLLCSSVLYALCFAAMAASGRRWRPASQEMRDFLTANPGMAAGMPMGPALAASFLACLWLGPAVSIG